MNGEHLTAKELNKTNYIRSHESKQSKVDINDLLSKVRYQENKEKKGNYIFLGLVCAVVAITGVIASF